MYMKISVYYHVDTIFNFIIIQTINPLEFMVNRVIVTAKKKKKLKRKL